MNTNYSIEAIRNVIDLFSSAVVSENGNAWSIRDMGLSGLDTSRTFASRNEAVTFLSQYVLNHLTSARTNAA